MVLREDSVGDEPVPHDELRARVIAAGRRLLAESGRAALTTRAVAALAGVQAPTLYRLFGDMNGLLEALAEDAMRSFVSGKKLHTVDDPLEDFRRGWDLTVSFGLAHPAIYLFMVGHPRPGELTPAAATGVEILRQKLHRLAKAGLLRVRVERALNLVRAAGVGTVLALLGMSEGQRDLGLSDAARDAIMAAITRADSVLEHDGLAGAAIALRACLDEADSLTPGEHLLLGELLEKLSRP